MLKIIVCIKQVPHTDNVQIDINSGTLKRDNIEHIMNPDDLHALEMALHLKETFKAEITAITMGPPSAKDILFEAYSMGIDRAILITDEKFAGSDSYITGQILSKMIKKIDNFDIIITGVEAIDGNTASVGYHISEFFQIPLITQIHKINIEKNEAIIERLYGHEYQKVSVKLPIIITVSKDDNRVRFSSLADIYNCYDKNIITVNINDLGGDENDYGISGSPTFVLKTESFIHKREQIKLEGTLDEKTDKLIKELQKADIIKF